MRTLRLAGGIADWVLLSIQCPKPVEPRANGPGNGSFPPPGTVSIPPPTRAGATTCTKPSSSALTIPPQGHRIESRRRLGRGLAAEPQGVETNSGHSTRSGTSPTRTSSPGPGLCAPWPSFPPRS
jgi:hypothetical protein